MYKLMQNNSCGLLSHFSTKIYLKISILMGITWIIDFIGWLAVSKLFPKWHWAVFDVGNIIQSIGIFVIFVCNKDMRRKIFQKYKLSAGRDRFVRHTIGQIWIILINEKLPVFKDRLQVWMNYTNGTPTDLRQQHEIRIKITTIL